MTQKQLVGQNGQRILVRSRDRPPCQLLRGKISREILRYLPFFQNGRADIREPEIGQEQVEMPAPARRGAQHEAGETNILMNQAALVNREKRFASLKDEIGNHL